MELSTQKPGRTLGMMLAIVSAALLFGVLPLLQVAAIVLVQGRLQSGLADLSAVADGVQTGGDFLGVNAVSAGVQAALAAAFLIVCVLAWRVRHPQVRFLFILSVTALAIVSVAATLAASSGGAMDSGAELARQVSCGVIAVQVLVPLYVVWYMSRAPARAFYRGRY
jgi:hypothetical protein